MSTSSTASRSPELDGLRCFAFLAVFALHAKPEVFPWGVGGVPLFFALSGFLITRILVRGSSGILGPDLGRFYFRRTLRIFPLYYAVLVLAQLSGHLRNPWWFVTYTYNIRAFLDRGVVRMLGHLWSLSVEEQFYLLYPLVLLLTPARRRLALLGALIVGSKAFQVYAESHFDIHAARLLLPYCGEDLLWGCLAGLLDVRSKAGRHEGLACFLAGAPLLVLAWNMQEHRLPLPIATQDVVSVTLSAIGNAFLVFGASRCTTRWLLGPLRWAPVVYLGRISYGLYVFHVPVLTSMYEEVPYGYLIPTPWGELAFTIVLAALSWHLYEGPINRFKDRVR
jgi:peptidoglycan/LPS O-acetylase OafA/YrhL